MRFIKILGHGAEQLQTVKGDWLDFTFQFTIRCPATLKNASSSTLIFSGAISYTFVELNN